MAKEPVNFRLDSEVREAVRALARERRWSESATIAYLVERGLEKTAAIPRILSDHPRPHQQPPDDDEIIRVPAGEE